MDLEEVEARLVRPPRRAHVVGLHRVHVGAVHLARDLTVGEVGDRRGAHDRPGAALERTITAFPHDLRGRLAPGVTELHPDLRPALRVNGGHDAPPSVGMLRQVHPRAPRRDASLAGHIGHLAHDEAGAAHRPGEVVREVEVVRKAVDRGVHAHRRDDDAVRDDELAESERREHRGGARLRAGGALLVPGANVLGEGRVAELQVVERDPLAPREEAERELRRIELAVALHVLEPHEAVLRRLLRALDDRPACLLVGLERLRDARRMLEQRLHQRDRVLHRQLGPGADREVRRVRGIAHEDDVPVAPLLVLHRRELDPLGAVREELLSAEVLSEELLEVGDALLRRHPVEPRGAERLLIALGDEGARVRIEAVGMHLEHAVLVLFEVEGERVELLLRPEPHVPRVAKVERRLERICVAVADLALHPVAGDHEIGAAEALHHLLVIVHLGVEHELHAELATTILEDVQEVLPGDAREAVPAGAEGDVLVVDVDRVPVREALRDRLVRGPVVLLQVGERLVGEHDAPSEGHARRIALDDGDLRLRSRFLVEEREVEARGATADAHDLHESPTPFLASSLYHLGRARASRTPPAAASLLTRRVGHAAARQPRPSPTRPCRSASSTEPPGSVAHPEKNAAPSISGRRVRSLRHRSRAEEWVTFSARARSSVPPRLREACGAGRASGRSWEHRARVRGAAGTEHGVPPPHLARPCLRREDSDRSRANTPPRARHLPPNPSRPVPPRV